MNQQAASTAITTHNAEAGNILTAAQEGGALDKILKFKKGQYLIGDEHVPLGSEYLAHTVGWTRCWIKFADGKVVERKLYHVARGERPPDREELGDLNEAMWPPGIDGKPADPWVLQHLLPLENLTTGEVVVFVTPSVGGRQAINDLARAYARRTLKGQHGQPIVRLAVGTMPTKNFGDVQRPLFEIVRWDEAEASLAMAAPVDAAVQKAGKRDDMDDAIPF